MSVKIPSSFDFGIDLGLDLDISGIPTSYTLTAKLDPVSIALDLAPVEIKPIDFSLRVKEIPSVRVHLPLDYRLGLNVLGFELLCLRLCGQGQVITEPYVPNPCEARPPSGSAQDGPDLQALDRLVAGTGHG
jgi:hypothetical protein